MGGAPRAAGFHEEPTLLLGRLNRASFLSFAACRSRRLVTLMRRSGLQRGGGALQPTSAANSEPSFAFAAVHSSGHMRIRVGLML